MSTQSNKRTYSNLIDEAAATGLKFIDELPPDMRGTRAPWDSVRLELLSNRGRWAEVASFPAGERNKAVSVATSLRRTHRGERYEAVTRRIGDMVHVYARAVDA